MPEISGKGMTIPIELVVLISQWVSLSTAIDTFGSGVVLTCRQLDDQTYSRILRTCRTFHDQLKRQGLHSLDAAVLGPHTNIDKLKEKIEKNTESLRNLSLDGYWPTEEDAGHFASRPIALFPRGNKDGLTLKEFTFTISWRHFDVETLSCLRIEHLVELKIPISQPTDLQILGISMSRMPELRSLHLNDIPATFSYLEEIGWIGNGILTLPKLKSLGIALTNPIRPESWARDERFERDDDLSGYFDQIFQPATYGEPSDQQRREYVDQHAKDPRDDVHSTGVTLAAWRQPLALEKLYLKHVDIPSHAWKWVFRPEILVDLQLPYSVTESETWSTLKLCGTQLKRLQCIDFEMLSSELLDFLTTQCQLEVLEFSAGEDDYIAVPDYSPTLLPSDDWWIMKRKSHDVFAPARRGSYWTGPEHITFTEEGEAQYENLHNPKAAFLCTLKYLPGLKKLTLTADMFIVTAGFLLDIGRLLKGLEELELGFDYRNQEIFKAFCDTTRCLPRLRKTTFRSLSRPQPLDGYYAEGIHQDWLRHEEWTMKLSPNLRHVRMRAHCDDSYKGKYIETDVYYRRDSPVMLDGYRDFWYKFPFTEADPTTDDAFEDGRVPSLADLEAVAEVDSFSSGDYDVDESELELEDDWSDGDDAVV